MDASEIVISICTICYNHAEFIKSCLTGCQSQQTHYSIEHVISDDKSVDGTYDIIQSFAEKSHRPIRVIKSKENIGMIPNFVRALGACKGEYIAICEGDDYWTDPYKLQKQVDFLEANPKYSMCVHNAIVHYEDGEVQDHYFNAADQKGLITTEDLIEKWSFATASIVFRRSMMDERILNNPYKIYNGDLFLAFMMSLEGPIKYLPDMMSVYRRYDLGNRYKGSESYSICNRIALMRIFDEITNKKYHIKIELIINELKHHLRLQELYSKYPFMRRMRGLVPCGLKNKLLRSL